MRKLIFLLTLIGSLIAGAPADAQTRPEITAPVNRSPAATMYVGNSFFYFNNGMPSYVLRLGEAVPEPVKLAGTMVTIGGSGMDWHDLEFYLRPNAIGYYTFDKDNNIVFNKRNKFYDTVVMMDCSQCPIHPQLSAVFKEYAKKNAEIARKHDMEPVLFMSWAYQDRPEMTASLADAYTREGNANRMLVIPAGLAFARVVAERPDLNLYQPDKRHPSLIGTYLAAATIYAALAQRSAEESTFTSGIDPEVARYLRATAWTVTREYYGATAVTTAGAKP
ncbi:MAG: hypothetical protein EKK41_11865 [Hyphomicrobiales bacterium]|nr:MAG: hypothetical protein EKK41_11865 [Hyphomicrobiales bacterium]